MKKVMAILCFVLSIGMFEIESKVNDRVKAEENIIYGDINLDSEVTSEDALLVLQCVTNLVSLTEEQNVKADLDGDNIVTSTDALMILQYVVGLRDNLEGGNTSSEPPTTSGNTNTGGTTNSSPVTTTKQEVKETTVATTTQQPIVTTTEATTTEAIVTTTEAPVTTTIEETEPEVIETEYPGQGLTWEGTIRWGCQNAEQMAFVETTLDTVLAEKWDWAWDAVDEDLLSLRTNSAGGDEYLAHMILAIENIAGQLHYTKTGYNTGDEGYDSAYQYMVGLSDCGGEAQIRRAIWNRFGYETELVVSESYNHGWVALYYNGHTYHIDGGVIHYVDDAVYEAAPDVYFLDN